MMPLAIGLAALGLSAVLFGWGSYVAAIPGGKVPVKPILALSLQWFGMLAALGGVALGYRALGALHAGLVTPAVFAATFGLLFVWLYLQRRVPAAEIQVKTGEPMLPFSLQDDSGADVHSDSLRGKRMLLKFFRGGW